jgi:plastocyanin
MKLPMLRIPILALAVLGIAGTPATAADQVVVVAAHWIYSPTPVHVTQGQALTFGNFDWLSGEGHSLTHAVARGTERFTSPIVPLASTARVAGVERLPAGTYHFTCRVHPFMAGTLVVE